MDQVGSTTRSTISIVIPAYNASRFLTRAVASCERLSDCDLQIVIVDDGSTDCTPQIARELAVQDPRITVIHQENRGLAEARNSGLRCITGEYVVLLDADDELLPGWLSEAIVALEGNDHLDGVYGAYYLIHADASGNVERRDTPKALDLTTLIDHNAVPVNIFVLRAALYQRLGAFDASLSTHEDWQYWLRAANSGWRLKRLDRDCCIVHVHTLNMSHNWRRMSAGRIACLNYAEQHFALTPKQLRRLRSRRAADRFFGTLDRIYEATDGRPPEECLQELLRSLNEMPLLRSHNQLFIAVRALLLLQLRIVRLQRLLKRPRTKDLRRMLKPIWRASPLATQPAVSNPAEKR